MHIYKTLKANNANTDSNKRTKKQTGSRPVKMVMEAAKRNTNYLLVPVNISKEQAGRLHNRTDAQRYAALNELGEEKNNCYWRDTVGSSKTSTSEHLTAFANVARNPIRNVDGSCVDHIWFFYLQACDEKSLRIWHVLPTFFDNPSFLAGSRVSVCFCFTKLIFIAVSFRYNPYRNCKHATQYRTTRCLKV